MKWLMPTKEDFPLPWSQNGKTVFKGSAKNDIQV